MHGLENVAEEPRCIEAVDTTQVISLPSGWTSCMHQVVYKQGKVTDRKKHYNNCNTYRVLLRAHICNVDARKCISGSLYIMVLLMCS